MISGKAIIGNASDVYNFSNKNLNMEQNLLVKRKIDIPQRVTSFTLIQVKF